MPDDPNTAEPGKPRRRWFQFRLRTLLVIIAVASVCMAIGVHLERKWMKERNEQLQRLLDADFVPVDSALSR